MMAVTQETPRQRKATRIDSYLEQYLCGAISPAEMVSRICTVVTQSATVLVDTLVDDSVPRSEAATLERLNRSLDILRNEDKDYILFLIEEYLDHQCTAVSIVHAIGLLLPVGKRREQSRTREKKPERALWLEIPTAMEIDAKIHHLLARPPLDERPIKPYLDNARPVVRYDDPDDSPLVFRHTDNTPFCRDSTCPCKNNLEAIVGVYDRYQKGLLTIDQALAITIGDLPL